MTSPYSHIPREGGIYLEDLQARCGWTLATLADWLADKQRARLVRVNCPAAVWEAATGNRCHLTPENENKAPLGAAIKITRTTESCLNG